MRRTGEAEQFLARAGARAAAAAGMLLLAACGSRYVPPPEIADAEAKLPQKIDYNWHVRPILSQNCFRCHGLAASTRKAGLRLDVADSAYGVLPESPGKHAIVPGRPGESELIRRITSTDPDERMPPKEAHKVLSSVEVATLLKWVEQGAEYRQHWAYIPPAFVRPKPSAFEHRATNPIDQYVFARLEQEKLAPSPEADRETLINRVTVDLTGLPPTLEEVDAFVADKSPRAYEKLVDRLLASATHAERMATMWLDVARYGDSDGYLNDGTGRLLHPYRDWVIAAFARNLPYKDFVTWQVAGDLLPAPRTEQLLATSFLRMGKRNAEGGIIDEEFRVEYVNERAELMGKAFMGLTVGCARCHDHKYDVISQAEYYQLGGYFNSIDERGIHSESADGAPMGPTLAWPTPKQAAAVKAAHEATDAKQAEYTATLAAARKDAEVRAQALMRAPASGLTAAVAASIDGALEAWYPLDSTFVAPFDSLMIGPGTDNGYGRRNASRSGGKSANDEDGDDKRAMLGHLASEDLSKAFADARKTGFVFHNPIAITRKQLPIGLKAEELRWTPSGVAGAAPGAVNNVTFIDGVKGKAVQLNDSVGFAARDVGRYERTQEFSLDLWIKLREREPYDFVEVLYNQGFSGSSGYELALEQNRLQFNLVHQAPYNMLSIQTASALPAGKWIHVSATYDGSSRAAGLKLYLDGELARTDVQRDHLTRSTLPRGGHSLYSSYYGLAFGKRFQVNEFKGGALDEIRVFRKALNPLEVRYLHDPASLTKADPAQLRAHQLAALLADQDPRVIAGKAAVRGVVEAEMHAETAIPQLMIVRDAPQPRPTYILERGLYNQHGKEVQPGTPGRVFALARQLPPNRMGLVEWLFDPANPLTARVFVNRLWQMHFGTGIVDTVEDFGTQGSNPTNPELLDWLAIEFVKSGWDIRHMQKLMVMSATYRQSSKVSKELAERDPRNLLLVRGPRYRLPAEAIRDGALFASGLLQAQVGGDSVFPYQPPRVWEGSSPGLNLYPESVPNDEYHRRTMYTYFKRNAPPPSLMVFDMADRNVASVARKISSTPLQALVLLNDPQYLEAYRKMAERVMHLSTDSRQQVVTLFRLATRRFPIDRELDVLLKYREAQQAHMRDANGDVKALMTIGVAPADTTLDQSEVAALTMVAAAVMNSPDANTLR